MRSDRDHRLQSCHIGLADLDSRRIFGQSPFHANPIIQTCCQRVRTQSMPPTHGETITAKLANTGIVKTTPSPSHGAATASHRTNPPSQPSQGIAQSLYHRGKRVCRRADSRRAGENYGRRRHDGLPISTAFVESAVNEILSKRMIKKRQMLWNRRAVQPFLDVRNAVSPRPSFRRS
jgi:hypothetical protein